MTAAGFTKNGNGLWEKNGATVNATISGFEGIHSDIVPVLVEMLIAGGFDAGTDFSSNAYNNMADGFSSANPAGQRYVEYNFNDLNHNAKYDGVQELGTFRTRLGGADAPVDPNEKKL